MSADRSIRVLYSFPQKLGADRVCYTAWQQVNGLAAAGAQVRASVGVLHRPVDPSVEVAQTLAWKKFRISYKAVGRDRALAIHDAIVAAQLPKLKGRIDIVHTWPMGARRTLDAADRLGIPTVLERQNTHTAFGYDVVEAECRRLDLVLPPGSEHARNPHVLKVEEQEYARAGHLLCPSSFVAQTFRDRGFAPHKLLRHSYGYDQQRFRPGDQDRRDGSGLTMLFAGYAAVRKGLHFALRAWLDSPASKDGTFLIAGGILPAYQELLAPMLADPSVQLLGQRDDLPEIMRRSDLFVLPSIEEGFPLVCVEAIASGCVPLVSDVCTDVCDHMENALVHPVGDVEALTEHITMMWRDRQLLTKLREAAVATSTNYTWDHAAQRLLSAYDQALVDV
jgi:glycosyltransferase involved in cell wall biosynthesis